MWELWRQDDNGQRFLVETFADVEGAEQLLRVLEARMHKQTYWLVQAEPGKAKGAQEPRRN